MKNIVFIGLSGSGKTTVSKHLADILSRQWFDSDQEIEKQEKMSINEIFATKGEAYFRLKETECIINLSKNKNSIIALGGGSVINNQNYIKNNAIVIYLHRDIENILKVLDTSNRPLLKNKDLYELYEQRYQLYLDTCDYVIDNNNDIIDFAIKEIMEVILKKV